MMIFSTGRARAFCSALLGSLFVLILLLLLQQINATTTIRVLPDEPEPAATGAGRTGRPRLRLPW